jgi:hypothetical protein
VAADDATRHFAQVFEVDALAAHQVWRRRQEGVGAVIEHRVDGVAFVIAMLRQRVELGTTPVWPRHGTIDLREELRV